MEQFKYKFIEEALDLILDLEKSSLKLSEDPTNEEHIEVIFRAMHSLKGASAMFGFDKIDFFTHQMESAFDRIRSGQDIVTDHFMDITFKSIDHIKVLLSEDDKLSPETLDNHEMLLKSIAGLLGPNTGNDEGNESNEKTSGTIMGGKSTYYICFEPKKDILKNGTNPLLTVKELTTLGTSRVIPGLAKIPDFAELDVHSCYVSWVIVLSTEVSEKDIRDVFIFVDLDCNLLIKKISDKDLLSDEEFIKLLDAAVTSDKIQVSDIEGIAEGRKPNKVGPVPEEHTEKVQRAIRENNISSIRVSSDKLDELINLVSELVTRQAGLSLVSERIDNKELMQLSEDIEKITRRLRDNTFGIRLIPVENMVTRFQRLVRELSNEMNKDIAFQTEGTDTEMDKNMIEGLVDPIMHIIRNSIDHGIECPEVRKEKGKPQRGEIRLKAYYSGANVIMEISDDGKGIDPVRIKKRALDSGLISSDEDVAGKDILDFIFLPGFSTSESITKISGRGVGMDVVKRKISELRGEVEIKSEIDKGTTIILKLPLTLSIIDGLLVSIDNSFFVIPLNFVNKCMEFKHQELINPVNNLIYVNDGHIPFIYLRKEFNIKTESPANEEVVVIRQGDTFFGLAVDHVIGEYQAVLKTLGLMYKQQELISGATILGDGTVALLLDPNKIISSFSYRE